MGRQGHYQERLSGHSRIKRLEFGHQERTLPGGDHRGRDIAWVGPLYKEEKGHTTCIRVVTKPNKRCRGHLQPSALDGVIHC